MVSRIIVFLAQDKLVEMMLGNSLLADEETGAQGGFIPHPGAQGHRWTSPANLPITLALST